MNKVQCKYKVTLGKINYFRVTPYKFKDEQLIDNSSKKFLAVHSSIIALLCSKTEVTTPGHKSWLVDLVAAPILRPQFCKDLDLKTGEAVHHLISSMCLNSSSNLSMNFSALATGIFTLISAQISVVLCSYGTFNFVKPSSSNTCEMRNYIWAAICRMYVTTKRYPKKCSDMRLQEQDQVLY